MLRCTYQGYSAIEANMKLPEDSIILEEKLTRYLLVPQARSDKSAFLSRAGYRIDNFEVLLDDLRSQILPLEATEIEAGKFGVYYEVRGTLTGLNGISIPVRTIWMKEHLSNITKFITLLPDRRRKL